MGLEEVKEAQGGDEFKFRGGVGEGVGDGADLIHQRFQILVGDGDPVDLHPLIEPIDVGGGVQPYPPTGSLEAAGDTGGGAALAVGAGDVDEAELPFRVAQGAQESAGTAQTGLAALPFDGVDIGQCFGVTHKTIPSFLGLLRPQSQATEDAAAAEEKEHQGIQHSDDAVQGHADGQERG